MLPAQKVYEPQVAGSVTGSWRWNQFPELAGFGIRCIIETRDGDVWAGSNTGVLNYDGYDWRINEKSGLPAIPVEQLLEATDGSIYATNAKGIYRFNGEEWEHFFAAPEGRTFTFLSIRELDDRSIVACSNWGFLHFLSSGDLRVYSSETKNSTLRGNFPEAEWYQLPLAAFGADGNFVEATDILQMKSGEIWLALTITDESGKLVKTMDLTAENGTAPVFTIINADEKLRLGEGQRLFQASDERIWVINTTSNKGILIFDGADWETIALNKLFGGDEYMTDIVESFDGTIWVSSIARIFSYAPDGEWKRYKAPHYPVPANRVILQKSQNDQLWVAGYKSRVLRLDCSSEQWQTLKNLSFQFQVSPEEQWFLGEDNEVVRQAGEEWVYYGVSEGLMDAPTRLIRTSRGQIWAAGSHQGKAATAILEDNRWRLFLHPRLSWGIDYRAVFEAKDGSLWFGSAVDAQIKDGFLSGVLQLPDPEAEDLNWIHHIYGENGLNQANVYGIGQSPDGRIWIGGSRLLYFDGNSWNSLPDEQLQQFVNCIHSTDNLLLVGSRYYGVFVFDGETWKNYGNAEGLSGNTVISIDALSDSVFIVATENGICKFDGRSWTQNVFPASLNLDFEGGTIYHTRDHIWINHVPRSWKRRAYQHNSDTKEDYDFYTTRYQPSRTPPETSLDFYREKVPSDGNGLISWQGKDYFSINAMEQLSYSYRMDGQGWSPYSPANQHSFTGLSTGEHMLEVRARDLDFNVDPTPAMVKFEVLPPIWKQGWFIVLILSFLTIFGFYEYRVLRKKRQLELLNVSLQTANESLREKGSQIEMQNREILMQQQRILEQSDVLASRNQDLQERNEETSYQRDKLEEMLLQVQKLSKAKHVFFTNISHELRTPLSLILAPIIHLAKEEDEISAAERRRLYHIIRRNASRLLKLINQLLEIRRIEQSTLKVDFTDVNLAEFLNEILGMFSDLAARTGVELYFTDEGAERFVSLDTDKVEKIVVNLLSNAFRHTPADEQGRIGLSLREVGFAEKNLPSNYERYLEISVADTGTGISPDSIDHIFDEYYTTESNMSDQTGIGIGLSYTKDLVYLMQGEITVSSEIGTGTIFSVYLPMIPVAVAPDKQKKMVLPSLKVAEKESSLLLSNYDQQDLTPALSLAEAKTDLPRVLIVEDNPDMLHFLENLLREQYSVITAVNGEEGLEVARNVSVDLILSDVMMAKMDGLTFCEKIKTNILSSHIPIILLTARVLDTNKISGYQVGADDYITKPFDPQLLKVRIANILRQREQLRETLGREFLLTPAMETVRSPDEEFMEKLVELMNENISESEFNVNAMCQAMHLSHMHFIRKVKQLTGKKPISLLKSFRMKKAKDLLAQRTCTISEVAYKVGFDLPNSFSRSFKKEFNVSPSEFVQNLPEDSVAS